MIQLRYAFLIALMSTSLSGTSQSLIDSTLVSKSVRLIQDYKMVQEINDSLVVRLYHYEQYKAVTESLLQSADVTINEAEKVVKGLNEERLELKDKNSRLKKNRKWWIVLGGVIGLGVGLLF